MALPVGREDVERAAAASRRPPASDPDASCPHACRDGLSSRPSSSSEPARSSRAACSPSLASLTPTRSARRESSRSPPETTRRARLGRGGKGSERARSSCGRARAGSRSRRDRAYGADVDLEAPGPADAFGGSHELRGGDGQDVRPPVRRPARRRGTRDGRARDPGGRPRRRHDRRPRRRWRARERYRRGIASRRGVRVVGVEPETSRALADGRRCRRAACRSRRVRSPRR